MGSFGVDNYNSAFDFDPHAAMKWIVMTDDVRCTVSELRATVQRRRPTHAHHTNETPAPSRLTTKMRSIIRQQLYLTCLLVVIVSLSHICILLLVVPNESLIDANLNNNPAHAGADEESRRLSEANDKKSQQHDWYRDVPHLLSLAKSSTTSNTTAAKQFRVLLIITSLSEYDKGTRGTSMGYDRLQNVLLPPLVDSVTSMHSRGWHVDVYLVLGYGPLPSERRQLVQDALPTGVRLEVWEDATPLYYAGAYAQGPKAGQTLERGNHALSRQHRFVLRDKLEEYDFFAAFEDDMRITDGHVLNFLELSADIRELYDRALSSEDGMVRVDNGGSSGGSGETSASSSKRVRHKSNDKASVGHDVVDDAISAEHIKRLFPGLLRVEVLDRNPGHPLRDNPLLDSHKFVKEVPPSSNAYTSDKKSVLTPKCCEEDDPARGKMTAHPVMEEVVMWETNIQATGVRHFPEPIGWAAAMP